MTFGLGIRSRRTGGLFPYQNADINWTHPLAVGLVFFAVPTPYGYFDLVRRLPMPHQAITASGVGKPSCIQLFTSTPLGMAAWAYGNGNTNPFGAHARTQGSDPYFQNLWSATGAISVACGMWSFPYASYSGAANDLFGVYDSTNANTGSCIGVEMNNNGVGFVGGGGSTTTANMSLTNLNNLHVTHGMVSAFDGTTLNAQADNNLQSSANASARMPFVGLDHAMIGNATVNACGRPVFWGAVWKVNLSLALRNLTVASDGNVSRNPIFGAVPRGLLIRRPH